MEPTCNEFERLISSAGWSNSRAAEELGLHATVIWKYRKGLTKPSMTVLRLLAGLTGQRLSLPGMDSERIAFNDGPRVLEVWEEEALRQLRRLPSDSRKRVVTSIAEMLDAMIAPVTYRDGSRRQSAPPISGDDVVRAHSEELSGASHIAATDRISSVVAAGSGQFLETGRSEPKLASGSPIRKARTVSKR